MGSKGAIWLARRGTQRRLRGCLLAPFNKGGDLVTRHSLDTEVEEYRRVLRDIVIPECMNVASDIPGYGDRIKELLSNYNPSFHDIWNFGVELQYKMVAPPENQTEENLTKVRILRAAMDLAFTMSALVDDVTDGSSQRQGRPAWHTVCDGGTWSGLYDGMVVGYLPFHFLHRHFSDHPGYAGMLHAFAMGSLRMLIGQTIDTLGQGQTPSSELHRNIIQYKAGHFVATQPALGLLHAGITDNNLIQKAMEIYVHFGWFPQIWDDFNDYYSSDEVCGKQCNDFKNGATSWVSLTAFQHFNPKQKETFKMCYGSSDPAKIETVKRLYDEVDIPRLYINHLRQSYLRLSRMISALPHEAVRKACVSHLYWMLGDICDPNFNIDHI